MITQPVLLDTGPLVAILSREDRYHQLCVQQARELRGPLYTTWPVVTEAAWLLRDTTRGLDSLLEMVSTTTVRCFHLDRLACGWIRKQAEKYEDLQPQLADLSLLHLAHQRKLRHIFTLDRRDFSVYRTANGQPFTLLPPVL